jgi:starch-binding outer membrane protein, SusD/RagB family
VDSVSIDSVWNSDSTWPTGQRLSRDCKVSFWLQGAGYARVSAAMSVDSGKTWGFSQDSIFITPYTPVLLKVGSKDSVTVRVLGADRPGVALRISARQAAPILDVRSKKVLLLTLSPGQNTTAEFQCNVLLNHDGACTALEKVYWDASADGIIDDSTPNANFTTPNTWTWQTTMPSDGQTRKVIVRARDKNGLLAPPDTVTVTFALLINDLCRSIGWLYNSSGMFNHWMIGDIVSDDAEKGGEGPTDAPDLQLLRDFKADARSFYLGGQWHVPYETILMANRAIDSLPGVAMDASLMTRQTAEAKFLRAWSCFILVKSFGDVPLALHAYSARDYCGTRTPKAYVWTQIEQDLMQAVAGLPKKSEYSGADIGRTSKGAAQALLVKAYIYQNKFSHAKALADTIILSKEYALEPNFADNFLLSHENGVESVFEIQYFTDTAGTWSNDFGGQNISIYQGSRDAEYFRGWGFDCPTQSLAAEFEPGDVRKKATIIAVGDILYWGTPMEQTLTSFSSPTGMNARKYLLEYCGDKLPSMANAPANWRAIRYAEVLLFAAEASNEIGNVSDAAVYLNMVRARAGLPAAVAADKDGMRNAIYHERRVELALEGHRFWDVVRQGRGGAVFGSMGFQTGINEIFPVPQSARDSCGSLSQNPGY